MATNGNAGRGRTTAGAGPRWHWTGHVSIATHAGCALVETYGCAWPDGLRGRRVETFTVTIVRGRTRREVAAPTRKEARARAVEAAGALAAPEGCA